MMLMRRRKVLLLLTPGAVEGFSHFKKSIMFFGHMPTRGTMRKKKAHYILCQWGM